MLQGLAGRADDAIASAEKAIRLSPHDPYMWWFQHALGTGHFAACRYSDAAEWERKAVHRNPNAPYSQLTLAASCAHLGLVDEAREAAAEGQRLQPGASLSDMRASWAAADAGFLDRYIEGLRKAGWKDE